MKFQVEDNAETCLAVALVGCEAATGGGQPGGTQEEFSKFGLE